MNNELIDLPNNLEIEYALLGCIISDNKLLDHIHFLDEKHFYSQPHAAIFKAMQELHDNGDPITPFTVVLDPETLAVVRETGGLTRYLGGAMARALTLMRPIEEAQLLVRMSQKREFILACQRSSLAAGSPSDDLTADEHAACLTSDIDKIIRGYGIPDVESDYDVCQAILLDLKDQRKPHSTGIEKLDFVMGGGLFPGAFLWIRRQKKGW